MRNFICERSTGFFFLLLLCTVVSIQNMMFVFFACFLFMETKKKIKKNKGVGDRSVKKTYVDR